LNYTTIWSRKYAELENRCCRKCALSKNNITPIKFKRDCPICNCELTYKSVNGYKNALKNGSICGKCASSGENNSMYGMTGSTNPFFGKKHTVEVKELLSKVNSGKIHTEETKVKMSLSFSGEKNGMFGKTFYGIWVDKFGVEEANKKLTEYKIKQSNNNSGEKNKMYGKPSPNGSGNGWSGWYKGWFFRSLRELTFMIKVIERFKFEWVSGEANAWKIKYQDYLGCERNYFPDFILNGKYVIESKPKKLWNSDSVVRKKMSAVTFCESLGIKYKLMDVGVLTRGEVRNLYESGEIKFIERYDKKYKELNLGYEK
jgi:hypothetical protein